MDKQEIPPPAPPTRKEPAAAAAARKPSSISALTPSNCAPGNKHKKGPKSLLSLCVASIGCYLDDIVDDLDLIAPLLPVSVKLQLVAIARRRGLLCDRLLVPLADTAWEILDVSGSDVTDTGIHQAAKICSKLRAVDVSRCSSLTAESIRTIVECCPALETLRCGGTHLSNRAARLALPCVLPGLRVRNQVEESWEDLDAVAVGSGAQELRWIVWPAIDGESRQTVELECPRVVVNPGMASSKHACVPREALPSTVLDEQLVEDISPSAWEVRCSPSQAAALGLGEISISKAELFRMAFAARDERLAPKRAKNWRQKERRERKLWVSSSLELRARHLADTHAM
ncbi:uncharacterized protein LOC9661455 [Selaginella moellendorffii]|nr:uncharacterized protein LOC9661455 [Selaginella moellendorffii]|eukprot:XP_002982597.2 uncharacterized protein LOC9661455 [Selaginella moellendorffii]